MNQYAKIQTLQLRKNYKNEISTIYPNCNEYPNNLQLTNLWQLYINSLYNSKLKNLRIELMSHITDIAHRLRKIGFQQTEPSEFICGIKLAQLVNQILYSNTNQTFMNKFYNKDQHRKGQQIVNISIVLKQIKNDTLINCPSSIHTLTAFDLIEKPQKMNLFLNWILEQADQTTSANKNSSPEKYSSNQQVFDNLYFASNLPGNALKSPQTQLNDSLDKQSEKVVKKGSFKILKPKTNFYIEPGLPVQPNQPLENYRTSPKKVYQKSSDKMNDGNEEKQQRQPSERKTVPKMSEKPPLYRQFNKQNTKNGGKTFNQKLTIASPPVKPFNQESRNISSRKIQEIMKQVIKLESQVKYQEQPPIKKDSNVSSSIKNIFKMEIDDVNDEERKNIVQWLVGINLLNCVAVNYYLNLHEICKNGVIFPEIINYQKGRGLEICYFKSPKRSSEINSNYQKVFNYLGSVPTFYSQLMYLYEYFVPQAQQKSFWSLMKSMYLCFYKQKKCRNQASQDQNASILKKLNRPASSNEENTNIVKQNQVDIYQRIKYGSNSCTKDSKPIYKSKSQQKVQFLKQLPQTDCIKQKLIQNQEPQQFNINKGYRQLYERKTNRKYDTPRKSPSILNTSMSRSRILSMGSIRKSQKKQVQIPIINLDMQMKAMQFLKKHRYMSFFDRDDSQLFEDPVRNGVLVNQILRKVMKMNQTYHQVVKSIENCRDNYRIAIGTLRKKMPQIDPGYEFHRQQIIKGDLSLFYGLVAIIDKYLSQEIGNGLGSGGIINNIQNAYSKSFTFVNNRNAKIQVDGEDDNEEVLLWIRDIEQYSQCISQMKIRDMKRLTYYLTKQDFLYHIFRVLAQKGSQISPKYLKAKNDLEHESNLKKIITAFVQKKWISSQFIAKIKKIMAADPRIISDLLTALMNLTKSQLTKLNDNQTVTFVKYIRPHQLHKHPQRLDTTMANQSQHKNPRQSMSNMCGNEYNAESVELQHHLSVQNEKQKSVELQVKWMRKLGFFGNLNLNDGVILCKAIGRLTMKSIQGINNKPQSKAQCLFNIRKALKVIGGHFKWQENDIIDADTKTNLQIYAYLKERYKHAYAFKLVNDKL